MCDFRYGQKLVHVKVPRVGYKLAIEGYTGWYMKSLRTEGWMLSEEPPKLANSCGFYIYSNKNIVPTPEYCRSNIDSKSELWEVEYSGQCVYGLADYCGGPGVGRFYPGVRAEWVQFKRKVPDEEWARMKSRKNLHTWGPWRTVRQRKASYLPYI